MRTGRTSSLVRFDPGRRGKRVDRNWIGELGYLCARENEAVWAAVSVANNLRCTTHSAD